MRVPVEVCVPDRGRMFWRDCRVCNPAVDWGSGLLSVRLEKSVFIS